MLERPLPALTKGDLITARARSRDPDTPATVAVGAREAARARVRERNLASQEARRKPGQEFGAGLGAGLGAERPARQTGTVLVRAGGAAGPGVELVSLPRPRHDRSAAGHRKPNLTVTRHQASRNWKRHINH